MNSFNKYITFAFTALVICSNCSVLCVDCEEEFLFQFENRIENLSGHELQVIESTVNIDNVVLNSDTLTIANGQTVASCTYSWSQYVYYECSGNIQFIFPNGKGYKCAISPSSATNVLETCLPGNRDPFFSPFQEFDDGQGSLITITVADYENAFEL